MVVMGIKWVTHIVLNAEPQVDINRCSVKCSVMAVTPSHYQKQSYLQVRVTYK